jgi:hypothetical protein
MADRGIIVHHKPFDLEMMQAYIVELTDRRADGLDYEGVAHAHRV